MRGFVAIGPPFACVTESCGEMGQFETEMAERGIGRVRMLIFMIAGAALTLSWVAFLVWLASKAWLLLL
jgi:hypothetical protein